jgi:hypothetical protein
VGAPKPRHEIKIGPAWPAMAVAGWDAPVRRSRTLRTAFAQSSYYAAFALHHNEDYSR